MTWGLRIVFRGSVKEFRVFTHGRIQTFRPTRQKKRRNIKSTLCFGFDGTRRRHWRNRWIPTWRSWPLKGVKRQNPRNHKIRPRRRIQAKNWESWCSETYLTFGHNPPKNTVIHCSKATDWHFYRFAFVSRVRGKDLASGFLTLCLLKQNRRQWRWWRSPVPGCVQSQTRRAADLLR